MIGAIVFFVLLFGYFGIVKGESDSLKVFLVIIGIVAVVWLIGSFSNDNNGMTDADYEKKYLTGQFGAIPYEDK